MREAEYSCDQAGNRTLVDEPDEAPVTTTYNAQGLPVSSSDGTTYTHDALGNLLSIDSPEASKDRCYFYDGFSNLFTSSDGEATGCARRTGDDRYEYDGLDRVFQKKIPQMPATGELFFYEGTTENLTKTEEVAGSGETLLAQGPNGPLAQETDGGTRFFLKDLHALRLPKPRHKTTARV
ncbi:MAG: hypothetical protein WD276_05200 [Actinomycetota bacterium]